MELDEAIKHCHEKAEEMHDREIYTDTDGIECMDYECNQCAKEHEQLAEWLTDYKRLKVLEEQERPTGKMSNREWIDFLVDQFDVSRTTARSMLHAMMQGKREDNFKKQFSGGQRE